MGEWMLASSLEEWEHVSREIECELKAEDFSSGFIFALMLAADEIFANISMYAYYGKCGKVIVKSSCDTSGNTKKTVISFTDYGMEFNPLIKNDEPDVLEKNSLKREAGGLGIFLAKKNVDEIEYSYSDNANILKLIKKENTKSEDGHGNNQN